MMKLWITEKSNLHRHSFLILHLFAPCPISRGCFSSSLWQHNISNTIRAWEAIVSHYQLMKNLKRWGGGLFIPFLQHIFMPIVHWWLSPPRIVVLAQVVSVRQLRPKTLLDVDYDDRIYSLRTQHSLSCVHYPQTTFTQWGEYTI